MLKASFRIILLGLELLTSNMMVMYPNNLMICRHLTILKIMPMAAIKRRIPIWSIPLNWLVVTFGNLVGSLFFAAVIVKCKSSRYLNQFDPRLLTVSIQTAALSPTRHTTLMSRSSSCKPLQFKPTRFRVEQTLFPARKL